MSDAREAIPDRGALREKRFAARAVAQACTAPRFDQRPGYLEATAGLDLPVIAGHRDQVGWKVALMGAGMLALLTPGQARDLAEELTAYADICEGKWGV